MHHSPRLIWCTYKMAVYSSDLFLSDQKLIAKSYIADSDGFVGRNRKILFHTNGTNIQMLDLDGNTDQVWL